MKHIILAKHSAIAILLAALSLAAPAVGQAPASRTISIDAAAARHPISPLIYGVCWATSDQLTALNSPLNRSGGNATTCYNWRQNVSGHAADWYFESLPEGPGVPGKSVDDFITSAKAGGAQPMVTVPMLGWVAKLGPNRAKLGSFSVAKYGPQQKTDPYTPDDGNGVKPDGKNDVTGNDPNDANTPSSPALEKPWIARLTSKWGTAAKGGVPYYLMDNEPALWSSTHRDVHPKPQTMDEELKDVLAYGAMVKSVDPGAKICAPESWGFQAYLHSAADSAYRAAHGYKGHPEQDSHGGLPMIPWLLDQMRQYQKRTGKRLLDVLTVHIYPQAGERGDDVSDKITALRARSTRALWDLNYTDESWINDKIVLIPRLKGWVAKYYPGTKIGVTEYNWGAENTISGATSQADIWGIFGREGLDLATRWTTPVESTPTFKAMQLYRNYDSQKSTFGETSVSDRAPDPDSLSSFAAIRKSDGALTIMVIDKSLHGGGSVIINLSHFKPSAKAQVWQLTSTNKIIHLPDAAVSGDAINATVPAQSVTLFVVGKA